jgi:ABC-type polysaccharide/polyol phosphate transport system ATPase subunit
MIHDLRCVRVSKRYLMPPRQTVVDGFVRSLARSVSALWTPRDEFWAVRNVSFDVARGEAVGIIGRNGAGKSTILKLLTGITAPTEGQIVIRGRLAALIELGSGFHPELTGRENAYLTGSMLGLRRREITAKLPGIIDFSGIGDFLDVPVKFYSSGMYVRLGFAIAALLEPDVLLVDEVLAVGDVEFQARCLRRIEDLKRRGTTLIIVSHDLGAVEQLCDRVLLLDRGAIVASGTSHEVITTYQQLAAGGAAAAAASGHIIDSGADCTPLEIVALTLSTADGESTLTVRTGEPLTVSLALRGDRAFDDVDVRLSIYDFEHGTHLVECSSASFGKRFPLPAGRSQIDFVIPHVLLRPGVYTLGATARPSSKTRPVAWRFGRTTLYVEGNVSTAGALLLPYECRLDNAPAAALQS